MNRMQRIQKWSIQQKIEFRILSLVCKCVNNQAPQYLFDFITVKPLLAESDQLRYV